jgi:hypothetical protein
MQDERNGDDDMHCDTVMEKLVRELRDRRLRYDSTLDATRLNADLALVAGAIMALLKAVRPNG